MSREKIAPELFFYAAAKEAMKLQGWRQYQLAEKLGITPPVVNRAINKGKNPGLQMVYDFAQALGYDLAGFFALGQAKVQGEAPPPPPAPAWLVPLLPGLAGLDEAGQAAVKALVKGLKKK